MFVVPDSVDEIPLEAIAVRDIVVCTLSEEPNAYNTKEVSVPQRISEYISEQWI